MIDINKLRRKLHSDDLIDHVDIHANVKPVLTELLDRTETAEKERDALRARIEAREKQDPVAKVVRNMSGQIRIEDAQGDTFDLLSHLGADLYLAHGAQVAVPDGWQPIETAPDGRLLVVGWLDSEDAEAPERHDFDWQEDGIWVVHAGNVEHADMVAPPGSRMPPQRAPYTHWVDLPPIPAEPKPEGR